MGGSESKINSNTNSNFIFNKKYNLIPSFPLKEYNKVNINNVSKYLNSDFDKEKQYIDLRSICPPVLDIKDIPLHPIASICSILNFQLNKNKLPLFPPSILFIYHNCFFYPNVSSILSYEIIFKSIEKFGFCSEIDYEYTIDNLNNKPPNNIYKMAESFKFIDVLRIDNNLDLLKQYLQDEKPLLITLVLYYDLNIIIDKMWLPDLSCDKKIGAISGIIVGYSDSRESFIVKMAYGKNFGISGYITIPYKYILDIELVHEIYYLDLKKNRIEGSINQNREVRSLENKIKNEKNTYNNNSNLNGLFS